MSQDTMDSTHRLSQAKLRKGQTSWSLPSCSSGTGKITNVFRNLMWWCWQQWKVDSNYRKRVLLTARCNLFLVTLSERTTLHRTNPVRLYRLLYIGPRALHAWSLKTKRSSFQIFASFRQVSQWSWVVQQSRPQKHVDKLDAPVVAACNASCGSRCGECVSLYARLKAFAKDTQNHTSLSFRWIYLNLYIFHVQYQPKQKPTIFGMTARKHQLYHVALHPCLSVAIKWLSRPNICSYVSEYAATSPHWCQGRIVEPKHTWIPPWQEGKSDYATNATNEYVQCVQVAQCKVETTPFKSFQQLPLSSACTTCTYLYQVFGVWMSCNASSL